MEPHKRFDPELEWLKECSTRLAGRPVAVQAHDNRQGFGGESFVKKK
jgi:hypothetical protein